MHGMQAAQLPPEIVEQARLAGGGWLDEVVSPHHGHGPVPAELIRGSWRLDAEGRLTGEYVPNPAYGRERPRGVCPIHAHRPQPTPSDDGAGPPA
jgi:hypothetical protein